MPKFRLFYSWQSDRPSDVCRRFEEIALRDAATVVGEALGLEVEIDSDTQNEPGTPPITETILRKIRDCDAFVADMTFVATTASGKLVPNPNVMGEYGYALAHKGSERILLIMNTAFGPPKELPFDLGHLRYPITFDAPPDISDGPRRMGRDTLGRRLQKPLRVLIEHAQAGAAEHPNNSTFEAEAREMVQSLSAATEWGPKPAIVSNPKVVLHLAPVASFARRPLDVRQVSHVVASLGPTHLEMSASGLDENEWWTNGKGMVVPGKPNPETTWYSRFVRPGVFEIALNIGRLVDDDPRILVNGYKVEAAIVEMLDQCSNAAARLGLSGQGIVSAVLIGVEGVDAHMGRLAGRFRKPSIRLGEYVIEVVGEPLGNHLQPMFDVLWTAAGISEGSISFRQGGWAGYRGDRAYDL